MLLTNNLLFPLMVVLALTLPALCEVDEDENETERNLNSYHETQEEKHPLQSRDKRANRCRPKGKCKKFGGSCNHLPCGLSEREIKKGCRKPNKCKCCAPKCEPKSDCSLVEGYCVENKKTCTATGGAILKQGCTGKKCFCCVPLPECFPDPDCGTNGVCELGECKCNDGWGGNACTLPVGPCDVLDIEIEDLEVVLPDLDVILDCISFAEAFACIDDFTPCLQKLLVCLPDLLPEGLPSECIEDWIDQIEIPNLAEILAGILPRKGGNQKQLD